MVVDNHQTASGYVGRVSRFGSKYFICDPHADSFDSPRNESSERTGRRLFTRGGFWSESDLNLVRSLSAAFYQKEKMKSLRRDFSSNPQAANVSSKVFVRSTKSGKVQKIVRELYLRQDIPCSSQLCSICRANAPADANGNSEYYVVLLQV